MGVDTGKKRRRSTGFALLLTLPVLATAGAGSAAALEPVNFTVAMTQTVKGSGKGFTNAPLVAVVGDTMEYHFTATNTGEFRLEFPEVVDANCDAGTIKGGPGTGFLQPKRSVSWKCTRKVTAADQEAGTIENSATITGKRPAEEPKNIQTRTSNTVVTTIPPGTVAPKFTASATCESLTLNFTGFPEAPGNTIKETVRDNNVLAYEASFTFDGSSGSSTTPLALSSGTHSIAVHVAWNTNGVKGGAGHTVKVTCP